jgi:hypothetical protein
MHKLGWGTWAACSVLVLSACKGTTLDLGQPPTSAASPLPVIVSRGQDSTLGVDGVFVEAMSTSLQPAPWQYEFFAMHPDAGQYLADLNPQHVHVQALDEALPWQGQGMGAADWDAGMLDTMMTSILQVDGDPLFQIMVPPAVGDFGSTPPDPAKVALFATYCGYLVQYFNLGYFYYPDATGTKIENPNGPQPIRWWAILGDWDTTYALTGDQYATIYNAAVQTMLAANADSGVPLSFSSFEYGNLVNNSLYDQYLESFLQNVMVQADVVSLHMFLTGDRTEPDQEALESVKTFTADLDDTFARLSQSASAADAQVWVTESNVNSKAPNGSGFVNDLRGTDAFFAAYRPYLFSQLGKHKNRVLYHWDFTAGNIEGGTNPDTDPQNAEVDFTTGNRLISYWVDYWLANLFPVATLPAGTSLYILPLETPGDAGVVPLDSLAQANDNVEVLAVQNSTTQSVVVMLVDIAPDGVEQEGGSTDFDGHGEPRSFVVDVSQLGISFASGRIRVISNPNVDNGPSAPTTPVDLSKESAIPVTLPGYGVAFLTLETTVASGDGGPSDGGT